jgi:alkylhydroperoxidase family enzyme
MKMTKDELERLQDLLGEVFNLVTLSKYTRSDFERNEILSDVQSMLSSSFCIINHVKKDSSIYCKIARIAL